MEGQELVRVIGPDQSRLNITWGGQNGDLPDPIPRDATTEQIKEWATEAVRTGSVPGIPADTRANFQDYVIERNEPHEARPHHLTQLRPKAAFGNSGNSSVSAPTSGGLGFSTVLFLIFLVLKLTHVINWSWVWVTAPLWFGIGIVVVIFLIALLVVSLGR